MRNSMTVLSRRQFLMASAVLPSVLKATASGNSFASPLALSVTMSEENSVSSYRSLVAQHANKVLPSGICEPIVNRIYNSPIYSNTAARTTIHDKFRSHFIMEIAVSPVKTKDSQVYYAIQQFVLLDDRVPRDYKDLNMLEMATFLLDRWSQEGILSPCNTRKAYTSNEEGHLIDTLRLHGYSRREIEPIYCRPVRTPSGKSTLAHAVKVSNVRDAAGQPKMSLLISPNDI